MSVCATTDRRAPGTNGARKARIGDVRAWEQGNGTPSGASLKLLSIASKESKGALAVVILEYERF